MQPGLAARSVAPSVSPRRRAAEPFKFGWAAGESRPSECAALGLPWAAGCYAPVSGLNQVSDASLKVAATPGPRRRVAVGIITDPRETFTGRAAVAVGIITDPRETVTVRPS